ncbi:MAG: hypothetical protein DRR19_27255 [Candidatus Parabeggiatoa sp. nov. 1]|nr:MAG: hypothetical protein DRR19_27255 [Gammaproteobacteria bacterium]
MTQHRLAFSEENAKADRDYSPSMARSGLVKSISYINYPLNGNAPKLIHLTNTPFKPVQHHPDHFFGQFWAFELGPKILL